MTRDELAARLLHTFLEELEEQVRVLNTELLALEREGTTPARLESVFRVAHTLKGAARATRMSAIEELCHGMEGLLAAAREGRHELAAEEFALLFGAADALAAAGSRLRAGSALDVASLGALTRRFTAVSSAYEGAVSAITPPFGAPTPRPVATGATREGSARQAAEPDGVPERRSTEAASDTVAVRAETQVRVRADKLDDLLAATGELMLAIGAAASLPDPAEDLAMRAQRAAARARRTAARLRGLLDRAGVTEADRRLLAELVEETTALAGLAQVTSLSARRAATLGERAGSELMESVRRLRLRPFGEATEALPRVVRDLATETGKRLVLRIEGSTVEADRSVVDGLREALVHLVRNAVDHGIERPEVRRQAGKPEEGTITVSAALEGQRLRVTVDDDGRGVDFDALRDLAHRRGHAVPDDPRALARLLFESGVTTRPAATELSGRGVGLDIVRNAVWRLRGTVELDSCPGQGTTFVIRTPLTLATQRALLVEVTGQAIAIPTTSVAGLRLVRHEDLRVVDGRTFLVMPDGPIPLTTLASVLGPPLVARELGEHTPTVIVEHDGERQALAVDGLLEETELVVRPLQGSSDRAAPGLAAAALLPSGRIALVASVPALVQREAGADRRVRLREESHVPRQRILVVDDSITTRTLEQSVLQAAGYEVLTAVDGRAAWELLQEHGADLVLTDLEMPVMDGYELCETIRSSARFASLPVVLVTSLESPDQRRRGLEVGADAYIVKSSFDQEELLETVRQLLGRGASA